MLDLGLRKCESVDMGYPISTEIEFAESKKVLMSMKKLPINFFQLVVTEIEDFGAKSSGELYFTDVVSFKEKSRAQKHSAPLERVSVKR